MTSIFLPMTPEDKAEIDNLDTLAQDYLFHFIQLVIQSKKLEQLTYLAMYFKKHNLSLSWQKIENISAQSWLQISAEFTDKTYDIQLVNGYHFQMIKAICFLNPQLEDKIIAFQTVEALLRKIYSGGQSSISPKAHSLPLLIQEVMQFCIGLQKKHIEEHIPMANQSNFKMSTSKI